MSSPLETKPAPPEKRSSPPAPAGRFDKAFPVYLEGDLGSASAVARNITETGMFVETREPFPLNSRVRVTFPSPSGVEMTLEGEVRFQCSINFGRAEGNRSGLRGIGIRFVPPAPPVRRKAH